MISQELLTKDIVCHTDLKTLNNEFTGFYIGDFLSVALKKLKKNQIFITAQCNFNVLKVAMIKEIKVVLFIDFKPNEKMIKFANETQICLLSSTMEIEELIKFIYENNR